jgi:hypothetical protein
MEPLRSIIYKGHNNLLKFPAAARSSNSGKVALIVIIERIP